MTASLTCPGCHAPRAAADRFCGTCGHVLSASAASSPEPGARGPSGAKAVPAKTMLGMVPPEVAEALKASRAAAPAAVVAAPVAAPAPVPAARVAEHKRTMLGMSPFAGAVSGSPAPSGMASDAKAAAGQPVSTGRADAGQPPSGAGGVEMAHSPIDTVGAPAVAATASRAVEPTYRTMLGVSPGFAPVAVPHATPANDPSTKHTMLGAAPPGLGTPQSAAGPSPAAAPALAVAPAQAAATPAAEPRPIANKPPSTPQGGPPREFSRPSTPPSSRLSASPPWDDDEAPKLPGASTRGLWLGVLGGVVVLTIGILVTLRLMGGPELSVRVVRVASGDVLEVEVPGSRKGDKVRFAGLEQGITAGRLQFPLAADLLSPGDNELAVDVVSPDGHAERVNVALRVEYLLRTDLTPLMGSPPSVDVVVDALPGARVKLDGRVVALDAAGHGARRYVVPPQAGATYDLSVSYRIEGPATPVLGQVSVNLPVTVLQIDKPGSDVVTDQALLEIAGGVEPGATVHIDGVAVPVHGDRFLRSAELTKPGKYTFDVIARAPGKAPRQVALRVHRVEDMALAAASFEADKTLNNARIGANPVIYRGQKVAFDGRIYNVEVQTGRSLLQVLVRGCPGAQRCPLWVEYAQPTDATVDTWVRVLGTVSGERAGAGC